RFDRGTLPAIPAAFADSSWHNDACPSFSNESMGLQIFVDHAAPAKREYPDAPRFSIHSEAGVDFSTDDWDAALAFILGERFAATLKAWLPPAEFAAMKAKNKTPEYAAGVCASADCCDSNMAMHEAFVDVFGAGIEPDNEKQIALWNAAWESARKNHLGHYDPGRPVSLTDVETLLTRDLLEAFTKKVTSGPDFETARAAMKK